MLKVRKAIIPAAGSGTRFLPATKAQPKEMLPIVDKPIIQYVVEEAVAAGVEDVIIVTGWHKRSIEDHFDYPYELAKRLEDAGKHEQLKEIKKISELANFIYVRQKGPYGNGTPVLCARHLVSGEPFLVLWGDDFFYGQPSRSEQMIEVYQKYKGSVLSCIRTDDEEDTKKYAYVTGKSVGPGVVRVEKIVEKPGPGKQPSDLASVSGYLLTPDIFPFLEKQLPGKSGEIWLVDAISRLLKKKPVYACEIKNNKYYDCGNKLAYLKTNITFGLQDKSIAAELKEYLKGLDI